MAALLVIEDSDATRERILEAVRDAALFERVVEARDGMEGLRLMMAEPFDMVLCDLELPGFDGEKLLRMREQSVGGPRLAFVFLTGSSDAERKLRILEDGACDLLEKPFEPRELSARMRLHLKIKQLQDELSRKNEELEQLSLTDGLTDLSNRRHLDGVLEKECARAMRYGEPFSLLMADLDDFKRLNDRHGHQAGDEVLRNMGKVIRGLLRACDTGARYGGEEFALVLVRTDSKGAAVVAERWRQTFEEATHTLAGGRECRATISVGHATWSPTLATSESLVHAADSALYQAKAGGRNRSVRSSFT